MNFWDKLYSHITPEHFEGWVLFICGGISILWVHLRFGQDFRDGLRGDNKHFDAPEISLYLFFWYSPFIIMSASWLDFVPPREVWYFMGANLLFALLGRVALERIISLRIGGGTTTIRKESKEEVVTEQKAAQKP